MPSPGDKLYKIVNVRLGSRREYIQVEYETFIVNDSNETVSTGLKATRIDWNQSAFDAVKSAIAIAVASDPSLTGFTAI